MSYSTATSSAVVPSAMFPTNNFCEGLLGPADALFST
jgi:hypothetical protein